jgi:integrase
MVKRRGNGEGTITRRKDGRWEARYTVQSGTGPKRKVLYGKARAEVAEKLAKAMADRDGGMVFDAGLLTLGDYLDRWLADGVRNTVRRSTYVRYEGLVRNHIKPAIGRVKLRALTPLHVRSLYREKLEELSPRSVNYIHVTLHKALEQAVEDGLIPRNVTKAVKPPQAHKEEVNPLSPIEVKALLSAARGDRLEALYVLAVHTGLRQGELLGLKWSDVDLDTGRLSVQRSLAADRTFNPPKRKNSRRTVKLTNAAAEALKRHRAAQNEERLKLGSLWEDQDLVFPNRVGKPMAHNNLYNRDFKSLLKRAGLWPKDKGKRFTFHSLRHTCATVLLSKNVNPKIVQEMLGHATITTTIQKYKTTSAAVSRSADRPRYATARVD